MILVGVQILRAVAASMVVWHHARHEAGHLAARIGQPGLDPAPLLPWWAGVDLFFVISGFVIVHAGARPRGEPVSRRRFLAHRAARVVPLYWLASLLYLGLALARPDLLGEAGALARDPGAVLAAFLFWPAARPDGVVQPLYGLGWTLNYEAFFYVLFALGIGFGRRRAVAWLAAALAVLVTAGSLLPGLPLPLRFWADPIVLEFALGAGLALARAEGFRPGPVLRLGFAALGAVGLGLAARRLSGTGEAEGFARVLLAGLPATLLMAAALGPERDRSGVAACPWPVRGLAALGDASYALYLVHPFALRLVREILLRLGPAPAAQPWGGMVLMLAVSVVAALLVHRRVERPLTRASRAGLDPGDDRTVARPLPPRP